jgi:hypothetical protein
MYMGVNDTKITRDDFMAFLRDDEMLNKLIADDRLEIFSQVLTGSSDISKELLDHLISDYNAGGVVIESDFF